jgi:RimJ/RimL family protein N-acetyltransferase
VILPTASKAALAPSDLWPPTPTLHGQRISLEPLRIEHAEEMAPLLDDPRLHVFIGGAPASVGELRERYRRQVHGSSPDGTQRWLNWIVREIGSRSAVGTVQATVSREDARLTAEVAWVIASAYQGRHYAQEAAQVMVAWLRRVGVQQLVAHVHPDHAASAAVARSIGLRPTATIVAGEVRWRQVQPRSV